MDTIKELLRGAYDELGRIAVRGNDTEHMAIARQLLRKAFAALAEPARTEDAEQKEESNGQAN